MLTSLFQRQRLGGELSDTQRVALENAVAGTRDLQARVVLTKAGEPLQSSTLLIKGFMARYIDDRRGLRQLVAIQVPGDFVDLHGFPMRKLDHSIVTLTAAKIVDVPHSAIDVLIAEDADLARKLWFATLEDAAMHRVWTFRIGRLDAVGRVAHLLSELNARLEAVGLSNGTEFALDLKQSDLAEACGLTGVHVNRVLRQLREMGLLVFRAGRVAIIDRQGLEKRGDFNPDYLYLRPEGSADKRIAVA